MVAPDTPDPVAALPPLRETIARHGLAARKGLGQHFLLDLNLTRRIARASGSLDEGTIIEVGPGPGGLTRALLLEGARHVIAIERDDRCVEALHELVVAANGRLELLEYDALAVDYGTLGWPPRRIVANLPYNISVPLLTGWILSADLFAGMTLMFQREVADRIVAQPGESSYGRLAVLANWRCRTRRLFHVPASAFTPPPQITSTVIHLVPYEAPPHPCNAEALQRVTAAAFGQRRKMLRRSLASLGVDTEQLVAAAGVDPTARAETLTVGQFAALASALTRLRAGP